MPRPNRPPRLLAVAYGGGHIQMVLPVLRALREQRPGLHIDLLALTTAAKVARAAGESPLGYRELLPLFSAAEQQRALEMGQTLLAGNTHPDVAPDESLAYLGLNAWALEQQLGVDAAQAALQQSGRQAFYPLAVMRRLIDHLRPDLVLATNSPRSEQAALDAASDAGLPTVALLDLFALPGDAFAARKWRPTLTCVLSPAVRDNLVAAGWDARAIAVTGNPAFDDLLAPAARASLQTALAESLARHARELTAAEQGFAEKSRQQWATLQQTLSESLETLAAAQEVLVRRVEVLERATDATAQVARMEETLNRNLASLAGAQHFEETVMSLAAAIHLLTARLAEPPAGPIVRLESSRRASQAA